MVPLILHNPYFGLWSPSDRLPDSATRHWTDKVQRLGGLIRVDGTVFRVIGEEPANAPALPQTSVRVLPTRTIYTFANAQITLTVTFLTPVLPDDIEVLARPLSYVVWDVASSDGAGHAIEVYLHLGGEVAVNDAGQRVSAHRETLPGFVAAKVGSVDQRVLGSTGDDWRIDWGYGWIAAPASAAGTASVACARSATLISAFRTTGTLAVADEDGEHPAREGGVIAVSQRLGTVQASTSCVQMVAYDEVYSLQYMRRRMKPYWKHAGAEPAALIAAAWKEYPTLVQRSAVFDAEMMADAEALGGPRYAYLCALAYRQCLAANALVCDKQGAPLMMPKENSSNGCIATIDVHFPMIPEFLLFFPSLAKATLVPAFDYSASPDWSYAYAPHDLGQYPNANGQVYGMGGSDADRMPVEESGNLILMVAAVSQIDGNASFASTWWPQLTAWVGFLERVGFDPENQLCTDDFAGHLAHNANLSIKAILAIAAYGRMAEQRGDAATGAMYTTMAKSFARKWMVAADDGDHYRLAFDKPGTWSQKYNLVWDRILHLDTFPPEVAEKEMAFYKRSIKRFGLPLDSRQAQAKSDWEVWIATLTNRREDFTAFIAPLFDFYNQVPERRAMVDWYNTETGHMIGFTARSVVGGMFLPFLYDHAVWSKWATRDRANPSTHIWAPIPTKPLVTEVVAIAPHKPALWRWTTSKPVDGWETAGFDASSWKEDLSGFGTKGTPGSSVTTTWNTDDIWLRRQITIPASASGDLQLLMFHDDEVEVYIDGVLATAQNGWTTSYQTFPVAPAALARLTPGATVTVAVHCHQDQGGQFIDVGFATVTERK
jgi:hypothetical protein